MQQSLFWAKTSGNPQMPVYKPVEHHLIDVAATALRLMQCSPVRFGRQAWQMGAPLDAIARCSAFLAGLHDLGKFSRSFQAKVQALWPAEALGRFELLSDRGHWRNTAILLRSGDAWTRLTDLFPGLDEGDGIAYLVAAVAGHHGRPPDPAECVAPPFRAATDREIGKVSLAVALGAMNRLQGLVQPEPMPAFRTQEDCRRWSWSLAGLTTLADWVGSDDLFFHFERPDMPPDAYWPLALERADKAIRDKGLLACSLFPTPSLSQVAPDVRRPRPMQRAAESAPLPDGSVLAVIEDATGSGKTEAALVLAARMMAAGKGEGLYFALPTMATANAMHARLAAAYRRLFAAGETPSLVLAHGRAWLMGLDHAGKAGNGADEDVSHWCSAWIGDNRRKAFFADVGAGTIDQAFLGVLRKKHLALRQYALAGRVLIVDEAHAFDRYMGRELETLLEVHAGLGGSAIVLSATLPQARRAEIVTAFAKGLGIEQPVLARRAYPLFTVVGREGASEERVAFPQRSRRTVAVERLPDRKAAHQAALDAARAGAAVLLIRNAVDEAIASFEALKGEHGDAHLFHARFTVADRQRIEADALRRFGRDARPEQRNGHILVATQVAEQSLDLDFDLVISDLAPVDLLIQRAGRLWRHTDRRPAAARPVPGPRLAVLSPDPDAVESDKWLEPVLGAGAFVYDHPGVMWRTAKRLFAAGAIRVPGRLRPLIESVYDSAEVPPPLARGQNEAQGRAFGEGDQARWNLIDFAEGYAGAGGLSADEEIGTRLGEKTATLRLARLDETGKLTSWAGRELDGDQPLIELRQAWALSEVSVRETWVKGAAPPSALDAPIKRLREGWNEWEQAIAVAVVGEDGRVMLEREGDMFLTYNDALGLRRVIPTDRE